MCPRERPYPYAEDALASPSRGREAEAPTLLSFFKRPERLKKSIEWDGSLTHAENVLKWAEKYFYKTPKKMTVGAEIELYILDANGRALESHSLLDQILENLPYDIWKDYYPYQLEIRTTPTESWEEMALDYRKKLMIAAAEFRKHKLYLAPVGKYSSLVACGIHIHVDYPDDAVKPFNRAWAAYPFALFLASLIKSSPQGKYSGGRMINSEHIRMISSDKFMFNSGGQKWRDWHYNKQLHSGRRRVKDVYTLEVRIFDTVAPRVFSVLAELYYGLMSHIKPKAFGNVVSPDYVSEIRLARDMAFKNDVAYSPFFGLTGGELLYLLAKRFGAERSRIESLISGETITPEMVLSDTEGWRAHTKDVHYKSLKFSSAISRWVGKVRVKVEKRKQVMNNILNTYGRSDKGCNCFSCMKERLAKFSELGEVTDGLDVLISKGDDW